jgi:hypothetical protein
MSMTRVEQTAVAFIVIPGAAQKHTLQLFNSIEKDRFRIALAYWLRSSDPGVLVCVNSYPLFYSHLARMLARVRIPIIEIFRARYWRPTRTGRCDRQRVHEHFSLEHLPKGANPRLIVTSLARGAAAAQELYEII